MRNQQIISRKISRQILLIINMIDFSLGQHGADKSQIGSYQTLDNQILPNIYFFLLEYQKNKNEGERFFGLTKIINNEYFQCLDDLLETKITIFIAAFGSKRMSTRAQQKPIEVGYKHNKDEHYLVKVNQQYKCVCELCSCGKHRCPRPPAKGDFQTSYNDHYKQAHLLIPTRLPQYQYQDRHYHPDAMRSNYKESFTEKPHIQNAETLSKSRLQYIGRSVVKADIPFYGNSSYTEHYKPFSLQPNYNPEEDTFINRRDKIPNYSFKSPAKFEDHTAYKQQFQVPTPTKLQKSPYPEHKVPEIPFYGSSSYKDQFKEHKQIPNYEQYYHQSISNAPRVKFEGNTTYKDLFKGFKIMPDQNSTGKPCEVQKLNIPYGQYLNSSPHISNQISSSRYN